MVTLDPELLLLFVVSMSTSATLGARNGSTCPNYAIFVERQGSTSKFISIEFIFR